YTPPELQGRSLRGLVRTVNHDRFGLAVVLFQLLFVGRHPYAGRYLGAGDLPFERMIAECRFAYAATARALEMERPPPPPPLGAVSPDLVRLFERAFLRGAEAGGRPSATEWVEALERFRAQLRPCPADSGHRFPTHLTDCPWCAIAAGGGPNYFLGVAAVALEFVFPAERLAALERQFQGAVEAPYAYD